MLRADSTLSPTLHSKVSYLHDSNWNHLAWVHDFHQHHYDQLTTIKALKVTWTAAMCILLVRFLAAKKLLQVGSRRRRRGRTGNQLDCRISELEVKIFFVFETAHKVLGFLCHWLEMP